MWAYSNLPNQTILSEAKWLKAFFSLSLVANAVATCTSLSYLAMTLTELSGSSIGFQDMDGQPTDSASLSAQLTGRLFQADAHRAYRPREWYLQCDVPLCVRYDAGVRLPGLGDYV